MPKSTTRRRAEPDPVGRARELARRAHRDSRPAGHTWQEQVRRRHRVGKALEELSRYGHAKKYGRKLVEVFVREWVKLGGFPMSLSMTKSLRGLARAFDAPLLDAAIDAGLMISPLLRLSRSGVPPELRAEIVEKVRQGKLEPNKVTARLRADRRTRPRPRKPTAGQADAVLDALRRRLDDLEASLRRLDQAAQAVYATGDRQRIAGFHARLAKTRAQAERCGLKWTHRIAEARRHKDRARRKPAARK